jgi:PilZ domain
LTSSDGAWIIIKVKRREPLNLAHVLEDQPSSIPVPIVEKRIHTRFDKAFLVVIGSELYGDSFAIARNISAGGLLVEMSYAPPLGTVVTVHFQYAHDDEQLDEIVARAEVKHHHYLNFSGGNDAASARAIGLRFLDFVDPSQPLDRIAADRLH